MIKISVLIATKDRYEKLYNCIGSILKSDFNNFEIIVIDQSKKQTLPIKLRKLLKNKKIKYIKNNISNKSRSLNIGAKIARGNIFAFTDDDCIVSKNWLKSIENAFKSNSKIGLFFGQTRANLKTKNGLDFCPATFNKITSHKKTSNYLHSNIGCGNNFAMKKPIFFLLGGFKEWLGPGSLGQYGEDLEITIDYWSRKKTIGYSNKMILHHDRWISLYNVSKLHRQYSLGAIAATTFHTLNGFAESKMILFSLIKENQRNIYEYAKSIKKYPLSSLENIMLEFVAIVQGIIIGAFFYFCTLMGFA